MRSLGVFFLFATMILGCATADDLPLAYNVSLDEDPYGARYKLDCDTVAGKTLCIMTGNALEPFSPPYPLLSLGILKVQGEESQSAYSLRAVYINMNEWMNIGQGKTLGLSIDGEVVELSGDGSSRQRIQGESGKVYEVAQYEVSADLIRKVALAGEVQVNLRGDFLMKKHFGTRNKLYFRQFVMHYMQD